MNHTECIYWQKAADRKLPLESYWQKTAEQELSYNIVKSNIFYIFNKISLFFIKLMFLWVLDVGGWGGGNENYLHMLAATKLNKNWEWK